jgi:hypothetical protein
LPIIIVAIGFEKPCNLAKAIMESTAITTFDKIKNGLSKAGPSIMVDYIVEGAVLAFGANLSNSSRFFIFRNPRRYE